LRLDGTSHILDRPRGFVGVGELETRKKTRHVEDTEDFDSIFHFNIQP
jgi:hypothetical protein